MRNKEVEEDMPRARNLKEAYNNFYAEPLKEDREFADFYVERPGAISPMADLKDSLYIPHSSCLSSPV